MSNYEYSSYSSSSSTGADAVGGFDAAKAIFSQVDTNQDGTIDRNEFQQWAGRGNQFAGGSANGVGQFDVTAGGVGTNFDSSSSFQSSSYGSTGGVAAVNGFNAESGFAATGGTSAFQSANIALDADGGAFQSSSSSFESTTGAGVIEGSAVGQAAGYTAESNAAWSRYGAEVRGVGLYVDANPQIIRRQAQGGVQTYTQNIKIRFLQPPPIPPPGPLIIKEVRPPQPPPPPPLRIKQQAPPLPQPPPLILRERPPPIPASQASQTVVRKLAALPVPPRSVIIERIPAAPPPPRDIIIERWIPYGFAAKRKTIVQRADSAKEYVKPRNIIIQYEPVQVRVVRQFQRLGVTQENPQVYLQRYGGQLLDAQTLVQQARTAGVVEDISPPGVAAAAMANVNSTSFGQQLSFNGGNDGGVELSGGVVGGEFRGATSSFSSNSYEGSQAGGATGGLVGVAFESGLVEGAGGTFGSSTFESSSSSSSSYSAGVGGSAEGYGGDVGVAAGFESSAYGSSSYSSGGVSGAGGFDVVTAAFNSADKNRDGNVDANEFKQFYQGGL